MEEIKYSYEVEIENVPVKWLPKIELFYPDLPGFPIMYVHFIYGNKRIYGFPVTLSVSSYNHDNKNCNIKFLFLCNFDISNDETCYKKVKNELKNRIGISDPVTKQDIIGTSPEKYRSFLSNLFDICANLYGNILPFGRFYEEIYSITRFVAAFSPKTGRQSEMRMLYNFLSTFGEKISIDNEEIPQWDFLEFYLLPIYKDIKEQNLTEFPKFETLYKSMLKVWKLDYTQPININNVIFKAIQTAWEQNKEEFTKSKLLPWIENANVDFDIGDKYQIELLIDAFNRFSWRACFFIWSIMTISSTDYFTWNKTFFEQFYNAGIKGCSEKVVACFMQQGFANSEVIPIDTWISTFYNFALGINNKDDFFRQFNHLGKLERLIWLTSQANKTNIREYMELLWCQRYGTNGNGEFRGQNPLSCYECKLNNVCVGFKQIESSYVYVTNTLTPEIIYKRKRDGSYSDKFNYWNLKPAFDVTEDSPLFICYLEHNIPKKIGILCKDRYIGYVYKLIDEFSGYILDKNYKFKGSVDNIYSVKEFLSCLPKEFKVDSEKITHSNLVQD